MLGVPVFFFTIAVVHGSLKWGEGKEKNLQAFIGNYFCWLKCPSLYFYVNIYLPYWRGIRFCRRLFPWWRVDGMKFHSLYATGTHWADGNRKRLSWNAHEILLNITVRFLFNFVNCFCIETLSHMSIWIHFGLRWRYMKYFSHVPIWIHFGFHGTHCVYDNHKRLSWNTHKILLNIVQKYSLKDYSYIAP